MSHGDLSLCVSSAVSSPVPHRLNYLVLRYFQTTTDMYFGRLDSAVAVCQPTRRLYLGAQQLWGKIQEPPLYYLYTVTDGYLLQMFVAPLAGINAVDL